MRRGISIVLPVYNERESIGPLLKELDPVVSTLNYEVEVIAVNDGSRDGTTEELDRLAGDYPYLKIIHFRKNEGQTAAFDAGFQYSQFEIVITMDADGQNDPADIPKMVALIEEGCDFVSGWRRKRRDSWLRTIPSRLANRLIRLVTGTHLHDLGCSLKAYRSEFVKELRLFGEMHRFIGVLMVQSGARTQEMEVNHRPRELGQSKYGIFRTFKVLVDLVTVWFMRGFGQKPSYVFSGVGGLLLASSVLLSIFVLWQKFQFGYWVHRNPLFMIGIFIALAGIQFVGLGLLAEISIRTYHDAAQVPTYRIARLTGFDQDQQDNLRRLANQ
ncbi:MAG: glycosyltransferase family 2 protein [Bdellovibrionaceae bacterium]|nr:glycosyltransferase family 2 protein [Bdellovibrionales bacterium]MCB9082704.1 glycosyltransferase family 2 protein [Pseudobdellovibrionaceae bacterium]